MAERNNRCWVMATGDGRWERLDTGAVLEARDNWAEVRETVAAQWIVRNTTRFWVIYGNGRQPAGFLAPSEAVETGEAEAALAAFTGEKVRWEHTDTTTVPAPPQNGPTATRDMATYNVNMRREVLAYLRYDNQHTTTADKIAERVLKHSFAIMKVPVGLPFDPTVSPSTARLLTRVAMVKWLRDDVRFGSSYRAYDMAPERLLQTALNQLAEQRLDAVLAEHRPPGAPPDAPLDLDALHDHLQALAVAQRSSSFHLWRDIDLPTEPAPDHRTTQRQQARKRHAERKAGLNAPLRRRIVAECGTPAGYRRHRRLNESPCDLCRHAEAAAARIRRSSSAD